MAETFMDMRLGGVCQASVRRSQGGAGLFFLHAHRVAISNRPLAAMNEDGVSCR